MLLALLSCLCAQDGWMDPAWSYRRQLTLTARGDDTVSAGCQMRLDLDAAALALAANCAEGFRDVVIAHEGRRVPTMILAGKPGALEVWFRLQRDLRAGARDSAYALYYGNPACVASRAADVFDFAEDFAGQAASDLTIDADLQTSIEDGHLVIADVAPGRRESAPARIVLRHVPTATAFAVTMDLKLEPAANAGFALSLCIDMKESVPVDDRTRRRLDELVRLFRSDELEARERALRDIVTAGRPAVPRLEEALRDEDPEVRSRAESAIAQINATHPPPTIAATVHRTGDGSLTPTTRIGKTRVTYPNSIQASGDLRLTITRDSDGDVEVAWPGRSAERGRLAGDVREISLRLHKAVAAPLGRIAVDSIRVRRHVDEAARPRSTVGPEERRK